MLNTEQHGYHRSLGFLGYCKIIEAGCVLFSGIGEARSARRFGVYTYLRFIA